MLTPAAFDVTLPSIAENIVMIILFAFVNTAVASILYIKGWPNCQPRPAA